MRQSDIKHMEPLLEGVGTDQRKRRARRLTVELPGPGEVRLLGKRPGVQGSKGRWGARRELRAAAGYKLV